MIKISYTKLLVFITLIVVVSVPFYITIKHAKYVQTLSPLNLEIYNFLSDGLSADFTPILHQHLNEGDDITNTVSYLKEMGYEIDENLDKKTFDSNTYDQSYIATFSLNRGWQSFFLKDELRITLKFNSDRLAKYSGTKFSEAL